MLVFDTGQGAANPLEPANQGYQGYRIICRIHAVARSIRVAAASLQAFLRRVATNQSKVASSGHACAATDRLSHAQWKKALTSLAQTMAHAFFRSQKVNSRNAP